MKLRAYAHSGGLFLLVVLLCVGGVRSDILLTVTTPTINQFSAYEFQIVDSGAWTRTGTVQLTFQSPPYSFVNNTNITNCLETSTSTILNCYVSASN